MTRLLIAGAAGRMGRRVAALAASDPRFEVLAGVVKGGEDVSGLGLRVAAEAELPALLADAGVVVDFTEPESSARLAGLCADAGKPAVIGTTGFSEAQRGLIEAASRRTAVFLSPNFSLGMNVLFALAGKAAAALPGYDAGISETHHTAKKDAPSGTALRLAKAVEAARPGKPPAVVSLRLGGVVGDHVLTLAGPAERIELTHRAESRDAFARGALDAAAWVAGKGPGLYDMAAMLGL